MTEPLIQKQVRLVMEQQCSETFMELVRRFALRCDVTLLFFDVTTDPTPPEHNNVAFKTTLTQAEFADLLEARLERWALADPPTVVMADSRIMPTGEKMLAMCNWLEDCAPAGVGFSLFCGRGEVSQYVANGERSDVATMLRNDLLPRLGRPQWRDA